MHHQNKRANLKNDVDYDDNMENICYDSDGYGNRMPIDNNGDPIVTHIDDDNFMLFEDNINVDNTSDEETSVDNTNEEMLDQNDAIPDANGPNEVNPIPVVNNLYDFMNPSCLYDNFCYLKEDYHELKLLNLIMYHMVCTRTYLPGEQMPTLMDTTFHLNVLQEVHR